MDGSWTGGCDQQKHAESSLSKCYMSDFRICSPRVRVQLKNQYRKYTVAMSTAKRKKLNTGEAQPMTKSQSTRLYDACLQRRQSPDQEFTIRDMKGYGITEDEAELVLVCQELLDNSLFILYKRWDDSAVYRLRGKADALK